MPTVQPLHHLLRELEERLLQPEVRRSPTGLEDILADDFLEFGSSGCVYDREATVGALADDPPRRISITDFHLLELSPDTALVAYRAMFTSLSGEQPERSLRRSVWKLIDGCWRMLLHQGTVVA